MKQSQSQAGVTTLGLLGVMFVALKLTGVISWSWWWVTLPFWGGAALILSIIILAGLGLFLTLAVKDMKAKK